MLVAEDNEMNQFVTEETLRRVQGVLRATSWATGKRLWRAITPAARV